MVDLPHSTLASLLPAERRRWPTFKPLHHSLLSTALPRSPLAKEKTSCSQRCTGCVSPAVNQCWPNRAAVERGNINLHYPPLVIHLLIAQNLWPPLIAGICLVDPKFVVQQTGWWWHKHRSNYCIARTPHCSLATWLSGVHGIYWLSAGPTVSTLASPVPAQRYAPKCHLGTFTKMHCVHTRIHRWTNAGPFSHKWQSTKYRFVTKMTKQLYVPNR